LPAEILTFKVHGFHSFTILKTMLFPKKQINGEKEPQQQIGKDGLNGSEEEAGLVFRRGHFASERN
jgi:hypothetical protein